MTMAPRWHFAVVFALFFNTASAQTGNTPMTPEKLTQRSYTTNLAHYIFSRSTGRPYHPPDPPPEFEPPPEITPSTPVIQPTLPAPIIDVPRTSSGLDPDILDMLKKYDPWVKRYSRLNNVDPNLTRAVIYIESAGDVKAVSSQGAMGLMQLMPDTAADMGVENAFDPAQNIFGGTRYLSRMIDQFGSLDLALWAYNAGPESVKRKRLPSQTKHYIPNVIRIKRLLDTPQ